MSRIIVGIVEAVTDTATATAVEQALQTDPTNTDLAMSINQAVAGIEVVIVAGIVVVTGRP